MTKKGEANNGKGFIKFCTKLGVSFATVNRWEKGYHDATILVCRRFDDLCKKHGIIFDDKGEREQA